MLEEFDEEAYGSMDDLTDAAIEKSKSILIQLECKVCIFMECSSYPADYAFALFRPSFT